MAGHVVQWGVPAVLIVAGLLGMEAGGRLPEWPLLNTLGAASYALYLTHGTVIHYLEKPVKPLPAPVAVVLLVLACIFAGLAMHWIVERPLNAWLKQRAIRLA